MEPNRNKASPESPLPAKLIRPVERGVLARERLFERLDAARAQAYRIIWIVAPPGSGKTVLASSYLKSRRLASLWIQLDADDADPPTFFHYLDRAAEAFAPAGSNEGDASLPAPPPEGSADLPTFTRRYFERLGARLTRPAVLVLDNYQKIPENAGLHELIRMASARLPRHISLLVISRAEPPSALARLMLYGDLYRLGDHDLRLTMEEALSLAALLPPPSGASVSPEVVRHAHALSQGWAVGLILLLRATNPDSSGRSGTQSPESRVQLWP